MKIKILLISSLITLFSSMAFGQDYNKNLVDDKSPQEHSLTCAPEKPIVRCINSLLVPIAKVITLISLTVGIFLSYWQYRLKVKEEIRLNRDSQAENDVKLLKLFSDTFDIAHCRKDHIISEKIIEKLFDKEIINKKDFENLDKENLEKINKLLDVATRIIPVGSASQIAAIAAIGELGLTHRILREPALQGLEALSSFVEQPTNGYVDRIREQKESETQQGEKSSRTNKKK